MSPLLSRKGTTVQQVNLFSMGDNSQPQVNTPASLPGHRGGHGLAGLGEEVI